MFCQFEFLNQNKKFLDQYPTIFSGTPTYGNLQVWKI